MEFKRSHQINEIKLTPYYRSEGFPLDFEIQLRTDASWLSKGKWETVSTVKGLKLPVIAGEGEKEPYSIKLSSPVKANAMRIMVTRFRVTQGFFCDISVTYYCRLSEIETINTEGENVALNGKAKVSSTFYSWFNSKDIIADTYKELYNAGAKWNRVGQWGDWTCWYAVEQKKGEYYIDPIS